MAGFDDVVAPGPRAHLARIGVRNALPTPTTRQFFALLHQLRQAVRASRESRWSAARALTDGILAQSLPLADLISSEDLYELYETGARACYELGDYEASLPLWQKCLEKAPDNAAANVNMGGALGALGRVEEALSYYTHAVELDPARAVAWRNMGLMYRRLGDFSRAIAALEKSVSLAPAADTCADLGWAHLLAGDRDEAGRWFRRALEAAPGQGAATRGLEALGDG